MTTPTATAESQILVALLRGPKKKGMSVRDVVEVTGRAESTVRQNIAAMDRYRLGWVETTAAIAPPAHFVLTPNGREVARNRAKGFKKAAKA